MRESELIEEGFERVDVPIQESGDKTDYYYYKYNLSDHDILISSTSDDAAEKNWIVYLNENDFNIRDIEDIQALIALFKKWSKK